MQHKQPNFPQHNYSRLTLYLSIGIVYLLLPSVCFAALGEFKQETSEGRTMLCATHPAERLYTLVPPQHGYFIRIGSTTLCYASESDIPEAIPFVETDARGLVTDAGIIPLTPMY
jgi:hypothetical protein